MPLNATHHAEVRMRQRGIKDADLLLVAGYADIEHAVGANLCALRLSKDACADARAAGVSPGELDRIKQLVAIETPDGKLVTCAHLHGRKSAAYRGRRSRKYWLQ